MAFHLVDLSILQGDHLVDPHSLLLGITWVDSCYRYVPVVFAIFFTSDMFMEHHAFMALRAL